MRSGTRKALLIAVSAWLVAACNGGAGAAGWTLGPSLGSAAATASSATTPVSSPVPPTPDPSPSTIASASPIVSPTPDGRAPLEYPDVQSYGLTTVAFSRPALPSIDLPLVCEWSSPTEVRSFYASPGPVALAGEQVSFWFDPRSPGYGFRIERQGAAGYGPGRASGFVGLTAVASDWASGELQFELTVDPVAPGPVEMPIED